MADDDEAAGWVRLLPLREAAQAAVDAKRQRSLTASSDSKRFVVASAVSPG
jgi:hypothetical protein